jgi:ABC-type sugar transport system ATPase subunit
MSLLSVSHLRKSFGGAVALRDASLELRAGETLALIGENGAGKSTLIKILAGVVAPDGGSIQLDGEPATLRDPGEAHRRGFRFIHQELNFVPSLSAAENIFMGRGYPRRFGLVDWGALHARASSALRALDVNHIGARTSMARLSIGDRMLVKIAAAFVEDADAPARIFVMDEPTAALTGEESARLFRILDSLRRRGCGILYVSHRLDEVLAVADRISVLRDGETRATLAANEASKTELIELMMGHSAAEAVGPVIAPESERVVLSAQGLSGEGLRDVSFELREGEILGFAGLANAGTERLTNVLISNARTGRVTLDGASLKLFGPADAWKRGFAIVPRERRAQGLLMAHDIANNVALPHLDRVNRLRLFVDRGAERARAAEMGRRVRLRSTGTLQKVRKLSGGNQQKVVFARAVAGTPRVLLLDEPTRGVDVVAKFDIYALLRDLAAHGTGIIVVSSDHEEILQLCSRVVVMREGRVAAVVSTEALAPRRLLALCYGEATG